MKIKTLILTLAYSSRASYYDDLLDAFVASDIFDCDILNIRNLFSQRYLEKKSKGYDIIVLLHSCTADTLFYLERVSHALQQRSGKLICFVGNEYNSPFLTMYDKIELLKTLSPNLIATQLLQETGEWLYEDVQTKVISLPHALNSNVFSSTKNYASRPITIGFRGSKYPGFIGDNDREEIIAYFQGISDPSLRMDISCSDRLNRLGWSQFLNMCQATISVEAGTNFLEKDDKIIQKIRADFKEDTNSGVSTHNLMKEIAYLMPYSLRQGLKKIVKKMGFVSKTELYEAIDFKLLNERYFNATKPSKYSGKAISSRHFDAIGTETIQVMFPGRFNDILKAGEHYIALDRNFGNVAEVFEILKDEKYCTELTKRTKEFVCELHTYAKRLETLSNVIKSSL